MGSTVTQSCLLFYSNFTVSTYEKGAHEVNVKVVHDAMVAATGGGLPETVGRIEATRRCKAEPCKQGCPWWHDEQRE
eukprot:1154540-Pelagomonas_calceolata.AAC.6